MRTLIADDDFTNRRILQKIIEVYGEYDVVMDGDEALKAFALSWQEKNPYDLILMDVMMPNLDGIDAVKRIRELETEMGLKDTQRVKVIMITALADQKTVKKALLAGASWYLVKPISKAGMLEQIRKMGLI